MSSLFSYRGMPLNKILATNPVDNAPGITKVDNPLESFFNEQTKYKLLTTTATMVQQNLSDVIYSIPEFPRLSSPTGPKYSAYYVAYTADPSPPATDTYSPTGTTIPTTYRIDLTDAKKCFSYITVILIGGSGSGAPTLECNGSSGVCVIYQIHLNQMGDNNIEIVVGDNSITETGRAGNTILYRTYSTGGRDAVAIAPGGQSTNSATNAPINFTATYLINDPIYRSHWTSRSKVGNDNNGVYTINGYEALLFDASGNSLNNWPIFYENPNFYGGTQGAYAANTTPFPYSGYARVYYML